MILDRVTLTGADDSIDPKELIPISREYPFVEWGILFSGSRRGVARYPNSYWVSELCKLQWAARHVKLSAHLCGKWVRDLVLEGNFTWWEAHPDAVQNFDRIQLNFHAYHHPGCDAFLDALRAHQQGKEYIFQMDEVNDQLWLSVFGKQAAPSVPLFDTSGGAGILPSGWPKPYEGIYCGYAGGLGPDNIVEQLRAISTVAIGPRKVWVDMETKIRSEADDSFDLAKCRKVLEACAPFVGKRL